MLSLLLLVRATRNVEELQGGQKANTHILRISLVDKVEVCDWPELDRGMSALRARSRC
jgi:hypothetical protein